MDMRKKELEAGMAEDALPECLTWCTVDCIKWDVSWLVRFKLSGDLQASSQEVEPLLLSETCDNVCNVKEWLLAQAKAEGKEYTQAQMKQAFLDVLQGSAHIRPSNKGKREAQVCAPWSDAFTVHGSSSWSRSKSATTRALVILFLFLFLYPPERWTPLFPFQEAAWKSWKDVLAFAWWGGKDAMLGIKNMEAVLGEDAVHRTALAQLKNVHTQENCLTIAKFMQRTDITFPTLHAKIKDVLHRQWVEWHLTHPKNDKLSKAAKERLQGDDGIKIRKAMVDMLQTNPKELIVATGNWSWWPSVHVKDTTQYPWPRWSALAKAAFWNNPEDKDNPTRLSRAAQDIRDWLESGRSAIPSAKEVRSGQLVEVATERKESDGKLRRYAVQLGHIDTLKTTPPSKVARMEKDLVVFQADLLEDVDATEYPHWLFQYLTFSDSIAIGPAGVISEMRKWIRGRSKDVFVYETEVFFWADQGLKGVPCKSGKNKGTRQALDSVAVLFVSTNTWDVVCSFPFPN